MPRMTSYEPGAPCIVELASPDIDTSRAFYSGLFGWHFYNMADPRWGDYSIFTLDGPTGPEVASLSALLDDTIAPSWICYFSVRDVRTAVAACREAGGAVFVDNFPVAHLGRMALAADTEGAGFGLWQPRDLQGAAVVDEPNTMCWVELACRDLDAAERFYGHVLGWKRPTEFRGVTDATCYEWKLADRPVAGLVCTDGRLPGDDVPSHWVPYFAVSDCDATAAKAERLGGTVTHPCTDTVHGRYAALRDPTEASLAIIELSD